MKTDRTFDTELPSWITDQYLGNSSMQEDKPIFPDHIEQGLIPCKECEFEEDEEKLLIEYDEEAKKQLQIFYLSDESVEARADYPHK